MITYYFKELPKIIDEMGYDTSISIPLGIANIAYFNQYISVVEITFVILYFEII